MKLNNFTGGLNTRVHPSLILPNQATVYHNCDPSLGSLKPIKGHSTDSVPTSDVMAEFKEADLIVTGTNDTYFHELNGIMYHTDSSGAYRTTPELNTTRLGIQKGNSAPTVTAQGERVHTITPQMATLIAQLLRLSKENNIPVTKDLIISTIHSYVPDAPIREDVISTLLGDDYIITGSNILDVTDVHKFNGELKGTYRYVYTYYDSKACVESPPSVASNEIEVDGQTIVVSNIPKSNEARVDTIRIYRIGGTSSSYVLVAQYPNKDGIVFSDNISDETIASNYILESYRFNQPLAGMKYLTSMCGMLFAAKGSKVYFSIAGKPDYWSITNFLQFDREVTGLHNLNGFLVVFTKYETYTLTGSDPKEFTVTLRSSEQGCINHRTIKKFKGSIIWASTDGVCTYGGSEYTNVITRNKLGKLDLSSCINGEVYDDCYYLAYTNKDGEKQTLVLDYRYEECFRTLQYHGFYLKFNDKLYISYDGKRYEMFKGNYLTYRYVSPIFTASSYSEIKHLKDIYIHYAENDSFTMKILLHTVRGWVEGFSRDFSWEVDNRVVFTDAKSVGDTDNYGLIIDLKGKTIIHEIEFKEVGRQNGR